MSKFAIFVGVIFLALNPLFVAAQEVCTTNAACKERVQQEVAAQNKAASSGPQWQLSRAGCEQAGREQRANEQRCRAYDQQPGGKTEAQCAKCYRQAVFDASRWEQCAVRGWAPPVPDTIYQSIARLGEEWINHLR